MKVTISECVLRKWEICRMWLQHWGHSIRRSTNCSNARLPNKNICKRWRHNQADIKIKRNLKDMPSSKNTNFRLCGLAQCIKNKTKSHPQRKMSHKLMLDQRTWHVKKNTVMKWYKTNLFQNCWLQQATSVHTQKHHVQVQECTPVWCRNHLNLYDLNIKTLQNKHYKLQIVRITTIDNKINLLSTTKETLLEKVFDGHYHMLI